MLANTTVDVRCALGVERTQLEVFICIHGVCMRESAAERCSRTQELKTTGWQLLDIVCHVALTLHREDERP